MTPGVPPPRTVVVAGASGFVGTALVREFRADGDRVITVGRSGSDLHWDERDGIARAVDGADLLVNLAGKSVNCRYHERNRSEILTSRTLTTRQLGDAVRSAASPPRVWLNASTATIYRHAEDRPMTESTGELGEGFSVEVAKAWEAEFFSGDLEGTRRVALRMAIVLGPGSVLRPLTMLARLGMGGAHLDGHWPATSARRRAGTYHEYRARGGRQRFSWIYLEDVSRAVRFLADESALEGPVNLASPQPSDDRTLMRQLRHVLGVPFGLPQPRWVLELGSAAIRSETELLLKSRWVLPERLTDAGFGFTHPELGDALRASCPPRR